MALRAAGQGLVEVSVAGTAAVAVEALSLLTFGRGLPSSLGPLIMELVSISTILVIAGASVALTRSLLVGVALSLTPVTVALGGATQILACSTAVSSMVVVGLVYAFTRLRSQGSRTRSLCRPSRSPVAPLPLAVASLSLYLLWEARTPLISGTLLGQAVFSGLSAASAGLASVRSRGLAWDVLCGFLASLGPVGLAVISVMA
ncbi:MAG: hypothetical protein ACP5FT_00505 [Acidilobus sp.]